MSRKQADGGGYLTSLLSGVVGGGGEGLFAAEQRTPARHALLQESAGLWGTRREMGRGVRSRSAQGTGTQTAEGDWRVAAISGRQACVLACLRSAELQTSAVVRVSLKDGGPRLTATWFVAAKETARTSLGLKIDSTTDSRNTPHLYHMELIFSGIAGGENSEHFKIFIFTRKWNLVIIMRKIDDGWEPYCSS